MVLEKIAVLLMIFGPLIAILGLILYIALKNTLNNAFWIGYSLAVVGGLSYIFGSFLLMLGEQRKRNKERI